MVQPFSRRRARRLGRPALAAAVLAAALAAAACSDPLGPQTNFPVIEDTVRVYAINGSPAGSPNALLLLSSGSDLGRPVAFRATSGFVFDLTVDFDAAGAALLYPVRLVGSALAGARDVGIRRIEGDYASLREAPVDGYTFDQPFTLAEGDVFAVISVNAPGCGGFSFNPTAYAKLRVEGIDRATRSVKFRVTVDPNCGFRNLVPPPPPTA